MSSLFKRLISIKVNFLQIFYIFFILNYSLHGYAHPNIHERINAINREIDNKGEASELFTRRGDLFLEHNQLDLAENDYNKALQLDHKNWLAIYGKAQVAFHKKKIQAGILLLESLDFCDRNGDCKVQCLELRAQLYTSAKQNKLALASLDELLRESGRLDPSVYIWQADLYEGEGELQAALGAILYGLKQHPDVPSLIDRSLQLQERLGLIDDAVALLEETLIHSLRKDLVYLKKSELLKRSTRLIESVAAAKLGLSELGKLPKAVLSRPEFVIEAEKLRVLSEPQKPIKNNN